MKPGFSSQTSKEKIRQAQEEVAAIYQELENRSLQRSCVRRTECCHFKITGKTPQLTRGEALFSARAVRASGRKKLPERSDGGCPFLQENGTCLIYAARPFGCRTHFCATAGGPYARKEVHDLIQRLEMLDSNLGGNGPHTFGPALEAALRNG